MSLPIQGLVYANAPIAPAEPRSPRRVMEENCRRWDVIEQVIGRDRVGEPPESSVRAPGLVDEPTQ